MIGLALMLLAITGDSHAVGHPGHELALELRAAGHQVVVCGRVGATSRSTPWPTGADHVVAFLGSNETASAQLAARYRSLRAIVVGPPRSRLPHVERVGELLARAGLLAYVDSRACTSPAWTTDGLHQTRGGARRWARCVAPRVLELLEARP